LDLQSREILHLRAGSLDDLLWPSQRTSRGSHLLDFTCAMFFSLLLAVSLRQFDIASNTALTA
jgi:hypothetical protein